MTVGAAVGLAGWLCACGATVSPQLPAASILQKTPPGPTEIVLLGPGDATALLGETERLLAALGPVKRGPADPAGDPASLCSGPGDLVVRVTQDQASFASNAAERNTLFIYETAVIVGIPVTLITSVSWPWYGEVYSKGTIETLWCDGSATASTPALASVRAEGRGFISQDRLQSELEAQIGVALARKLVDAAAQCGRLEKGRDRCSEQRQ
jgi:hypothetical protein